MTRLNTTNVKFVTFQKNKWKTVYYAILTDIMLELSNAISFSRATYHEGLIVKFNDPKTTPILKTIVNSLNIPLIPPLLVNNKFATDFSDTVNMSNDFSKNNVDLLQMAALFLTVRSFEL